MVRVKHGRRASATQADDFGSIGRTASQQNETVFKLQVRFPDNAESLKLSTQMLSGEYATRYLEQIGVKPSRCTMDIVHKNIPLTDSCVKTCLRSKGHISDQILLTVPPVQHSFRVPSVISALSVTQLGLNNQEDRVRKAGEPSISTTSSVPVMAGQRPGDSQKPGSAGGSFMALASPFLHPFNLDMNMARQNIEWIKMRHARECGGVTRTNGNSQGSDEEGEGGSLFGDLSEELVQELVVSPELVLTVMTPLEAALQDWYKAQAAETLKERLSKDDFQATIELLASDSTVNFFTTTINFLHEEFIKTSPLYSKDLEAKIATESRMSRMGSRQRKSMASASSKVPIQTMSRPMALQEFDLGYRLFVKEKMAKLQEARRSAAPSTSLLHQASRLQAPLSSMVQPQDGGGGGGSAPRSTYSISAGAAPSRAPSGALGGVSLLGGGLRDGDRHLAAASRGELQVRYETDEHLRDKDGHPMLQESPLSVRRSLKHLSSAAALSSAALARSILDGLGAEDTDYLQQTRLFALQKEFAALYKAKRQERSGMFFCLPVFLLFLRLAVSVLFSSLYTLWSKTEEGVETLNEMDATLVQMLDPHGYLQRNLSLIQSTPAAVSILAKYPHKSHEPERTHFADISPLLRAALPEPSSAAARRMMASAAKVKGRATVRTKLTVAQRDALYQDARKITQTRDVNLGKLGEPVQHTTRDSWIAKQDS